MDDPRAWAIAYLAARPAAPWRWADQGDVLAWRDGTTVAFRGEVISILESLVPHGWPPFGALVWVLAACRGKLPAQVGGSVPFYALGESDPPDSPQLNFGDLGARLRHMHSVVETGLETIAGLPAELRSSPKAKAVLVEMVFGRAWKEGGQIDFFGAVLEVLRSGFLTDAMLNDPGAPPPGESSEWSVLHAGLARLTPESIALRLRTGLDVLPLAAALPLPPAVRVRALLEDLRADAAHAGLARLVRDIMAAIQLPRRLSELDEMPVGGFSDITNRGNPDRLLLSELAHDDLTLAVRIALNEALYLRREPPARQPPSTLTLLLDSGVRLWGVPRVLAAAAALALVAKSAAHERCAVFRARGAELSTVDLLSKEGLVAHLGALEPHAHPGAALAAFRALLADDARADAVLITHREVFADPDFQRALALAEFETLYFALVDREGGFTLLRHPCGNTAPAEAQLDLHGLFPDAPGGGKRPPLLDRAAHPDLPLILSTEPFPFLLPVRGKVQKAIHRRGGGGACVMQDRRLLCWHKPDAGARTVASALPRGRTLWLGELDDESLAVVKIVSGRERLACRIFRPNGELRHSHDWQIPGVQRVEVREAVIFIVCLAEAQVWDLETGALLGKVPVSRVSSHGRYFRMSPEGWGLLTWNGQALGLEPVVFLGGIPAEGILRVFNHADHEGPWVLRKNGDVHAEDGRRVLQLGTLKSVARVSEDGRHLLVVSEADSSSLAVDLRKMTHRAVRGAISDDDWAAPPQPPTRSVRVHLARIAVADTGEICLGSQKGAWTRITLFAHSCLVLKSMCGTVLAPEAVRDFAPMALPGQPGFSLRLAQWPDGRRAWLDDRGMLHLRCADRKAPEVTIMLSDDGLTVWSSDRLMGGSAFFTGGQADTQIGELWNQIRAFGLPS